MSLVMMAVAAKNLPNLQANHTNAQSQIAACPTLPMHPTHMSSCPHSFSVYVYFDQKNSFSQNSQVFENLRHAGVQVRGEDERLEGLQMLENQVVIL